MLTSNGYVLDERPNRLGELEAVPEHQRRDRRALQRRLRENGYLYLRGALDPDVVGNFRRHYFSRLAPSGLVRAGTDPALGIAGTDVDAATLRHILFRDVVPGREYHAFCTQPAVRGWYDWFFDGPSHLHKRKIIRHVRPGEAGIGTATQAHYDLLYIRGGTDAVLTSWIPLGDCPTTRGGLVYLEGSHHWARAQEVEAEAGGRPKLPAASITADLPGLAERHDARWLVADYAAGDMVVHSAYLVHAALDNTARDGIIRLSTDIRYQRKDDPIDQRWQNHWHDRDGL